MLLDLCSAVQREALELVQALIRWCRFLRESRSGEDEAVRRVFCCFVGETVV
jgi:hypothetical protein